MDPLLTEHELSDLLLRYGYADKAFKYVLVIALTIVALIVSIILNLIARFVPVPDWLAFLFVIAFALEAFSFWLGLFKRFEQRWKAWQEVMHREVLLDRIEYYAKVTSSSIIANILVEVEEIKKIQKQESEKAKEYGAIQTQTMETFFQMVDERERRNRGINDLHRAYFTDRF